MRRLTFAHNGIIIGTLLGLLVYGLTESFILALIVLIAASAVIFILIRIIENALYSGAEMAADKIREAHNRRKQEKLNQNGYYRNI